MKLLLVLSSLLALTRAEYCYNNIVSACSSAGAPDIKNCTAKYGKIDTLAYDLQSFANKHIAHNFQYMLMSTHFNNYVKNREGFTKLYKKLSDKAWEDGLDLIKYMTKRGIAMDFESRYQPIQDEKAKIHENTVELYELHSLSRALDIQKSLADAAHKLHYEAQGDAELMSHIENTFVHQLRDSVRTLSGHTNDLKNLLTDKTQSSLDIYLFDEYLQKLD